MPTWSRPVLRAAQKAFKEIRLNTKVLKMATAGKQIKVTSKTTSSRATNFTIACWLASAARQISPTSAWKTPRSTKTTKAFIQCNAQQQTEDPNIYAIGDVNGGTLLAHRATKEGTIAVEAILGEASAFENVVIPAVVYTDPEVAWCGLTEAEAKQKGIEDQSGKVLVGRFGSRTDSRSSRRLDQTHYRAGNRTNLGVGIIGAGAGNLSPKAFSPSRWAPRRATSPIRCIPIRPCQKL